MIRRERESIVFRPVREDLPSKYAFRASFFVYFAGIDIADRQGGYSRLGQTGRFIGRSENSWCTGKSKFSQRQICRLRPDQAGRPPERRAMAFLPRSAYRGRCRNHGAAHLNTVYLSSYLFFPNCLQDAKISSILSTKSFASSMIHSASSLVRISTPYCSTTLFSCALSNASEYFCSSCLARLI